MCTRSPCPSSRTASSSGANRPPTRVDMACLCGHGRAERGTAGPRAGTDIGADLDRGVRPRPPLPSQSGRDHRRRIKGSRLEIIPGAGHPIPVEKPGELAGSINSFSPPVAESLLHEWGSSRHPHPDDQSTRPRNALDPELLTALAEALSVHESAPRRSSCGERAPKPSPRLRPVAPHRYRRRPRGRPLHRRGSHGVARMSRARDRELQGHCHGAAVELALSCDLRIAADDLRISVPR